MNKYKQFSDWKRKRGCVRKKAYKTPEDADAAVIRSNATRKYHCLYCGAWHITRKLVQW